MSSRDFYKSSRDTPRDSLPPIRDVLGDQLDRHPHRDNAYSFDAVHRALPDTPGSRSRSTWPQSGPTLPPLHSSRQGYATSPPTPLTSSSSRAHPSHSSHPRHPPPQTSQTSHDTSTPYSFDVFRPSSSGLVHASSSSRSQGILRSTRADAGRRSSSQQVPSAVTADEDDDVDEGHKKYACEHCGKRFSRPSSLRAHEVVHSEDKPFKCSYPGCGKTFGVASNMRRHCRNTHEVSNGSSNALGSADEEDEGYYQSNSGGGYGDNAYMHSSSSGRAFGSGSRSYHTSSRG